MAAITDVTVGTTATTVTTGTEGDKRPFYLVNESAQVITLNFAGSADDLDLAPGEHVLVLPGMAITATSPAGAALLQILRGVIPDVGAVAPSPAYDADAGSLRMWRDNPERNYTLPQQESATGQGDGVTEYYVAFEGSQDLTIQIQDTPGVAGNNTYKIYASAEAGSLEDDAATFHDVGSPLFGAASWTTDAFIVNSKKFRAKYVKIEVTRAADGGNTDGAWTIDIQGG